MLLFSGCDAWGVAFVYHVPLLGGRILFLVEYVCSRMLHVFGRRVAYVGLISMCARSGYKLIYPMLRSGEFTAFLDILTFLFFVVWLCVWPCLLVFSPCVDTCRCCISIRFRVHFLYIPYCLP